MTYRQSEESRSRAKPRELYKFEGTYGNYYYTSQQEDVDYDDGDGTGVKTYKSATLKRGNVKIGTHEDDGLDMTIELPVTVPVVQDYAFKVAPPKLKLTVYRYHSLDDVKVHWAGPVTNIRVSKGIATIKSPSIFSYALSGSCPSVYYQTPCNRILYDEGCKVSRADNTLNTTISEINGRTLTLASTGNFPNSHFRAGELVLPSGERRMIVAHIGNSVTVNYPFSKVERFQACQAVAGCDHAYEGDCRNKFNNQKQYGGFMFIPNVNPFNSGIK